MGLRLSDMEIITIHKSIENVFDSLSSQVRIHQEIFDFLLEKFLLTAYDTYSAIYLLLEKEVAYSLQTEFLNRTLIETLFNVLFIAEDDQERSIWYGKVGYKKVREERKRFEDLFDDGSEWAQGQINSYKEVEKLFVHDFGITSTEISDFRSIVNWPSPSNMLRQMNDKDFFRYVHKCFYGSSSELIHGGFKSLFYSITKESKVINKARVITDCYSKAATFFIAIMSEIAELENVDIDDLLKETWGNLYQNVGPHIDELIELRYSQFIAKT